MNKKAQDLIVSNTRVEPAPEQPKCKTCGGSGKVPWGSGATFKKDCPDCKPEQPSEFVEEAKEILEHGKRVHERWRDWYKQNPTVTEKVSAERYAGNLAKQEQWIIDYDKVLKCIVRLEGEKKKLHEKIYEYEETEAMECPEDVGIKEYVNRLRTALADKEAECKAIRKATNKVVLCFPDKIPAGQKEVAFNIPAYVIEELKQAVLRKKEKRDNV